MFNALIMILNYFHDLAVAILASNILVVYFLGRMLEKDRNKAGILKGIFRRLSYITYGALAYVVVGGTIRAYFFMEIEWSPAVGKGLIAALVVKHVILVAVATFGIIAHMKYQRKYGRQH